MELKFGIIFFVSFSCVLLNSHIASCHRTLPPPPAAAPAISPTSFISLPPSSSTPSASDAPAPSPTAIESGAPQSSPTDIGVPESSPITSETPELSGAPESSPTVSDTPELSGAPKSSPTLLGAPESSSIVSGGPESSPSTSISTPSTSFDNGQSFGFGFKFGSGFGAMNADTVKKLCEATENPTLCANSVLPFMKGQGSLSSALEVQINSFLSLSEKAIAKIKAAMKASPSAAENLQVCLDIYGAAEDDLLQAKDAVKANDMGLLSSMLSGAITDLGTCDDSLKEAGEESPLDNNLVATMHKLVDNCFDLSSAMRT